ncbi:MAG: PilZ domain-containing protein [Desulfobacterales bacterium]|nr:PilZ domain-containing protein [Desulfobacterales bacterium]
MERRNYPRVKTCNLISYMAIKENGEITDIGMGRALDISQNGIFLETPRLLFSEYISLMSTDLDNNLIEIKGKVIYSGVNRSGMIGNGIRLQGEHHENIQFATRLIKVFHIRKNNFAPAMAVQK